MQQLGPVYGCVCERRGRRESRKLTVRTFFSADLLFFLNAVVVAVAVVGSVMVLLLPLVSWVAVAVAVAVTSSEETENASMYGMRSLAGRQYSNFTGISRRASRSSTLSIGT